eukprot:CAMPEP_0117441856 /NCGR_PEP_ID=MMETSP0759-20121206/3849_1 /TAXON_ID=63605 /ORGANISM="Percolomonas cosmopolitus, Strain WS" /LENGTH=313 /DNA_ID=CAMNT_0005233721 /DNA_START=589 /DNA_END=1530 /DNA_ORIENTATION=-
MTVPIVESRKTITIASFNIQVFGPTKMSHPKVKDILVQTLKRFSVIFVQEIRDASQTAIFELVDALNANITTTKFKMVLSSREGRSVSKEQYAYIFRPDHVTLLDVVEYDDKSDWYERPPYGMKLQTRFGQTLMLLGAHISPSSAVSEIDHMVDVYHELHEPWIGPKDQVIFLGDFNAGCRYLSRSKWASIRLRNQTDRFSWLIKDDQITTTVGGGDCAYDRFVIGNGVQQMTDPVASVFNYTAEYNLDAQLSREVSDHYPIFMKIYEPLPSIQQHIHQLEDADTLLVEGPGVMEHMHEEAEQFASKEVPILS